MVEPIHTATLTLRMICVQYVFYIVNFVFVIAGTLLITFCSVIKSVPEEYRIFTSWDNEPIGLMEFIGLSLIIMSIIANFASIKQNFLLFSTHGGLILALLIVEINFGIKAYAAYNTSSSVISSNMLNNLNTYYHSTKNNWDYMQHYLQCCGVHNVSDWASYHIDGPETTVNGYTFTVPSSCCVDFRCIGVHKIGCLSILNGYLSKTSLMIFCILTILGVIKVFLLSYEFTLIMKTADVHNKKEPIGEIRETSDTPLLESISSDDIIQDIYGPSTSYA